MSITSGVGTSDNGLISGSSISNDSGCSIDGSNPTCLYGQPQNWSFKTPIISSAGQYGYKTAYSSINQSLGVGITLDSGAKMSDVLSLGGTGVFLINGDFTVDVNNTVAVGKYLMIMAKGTITFASTVTNSAGFFSGDTGVLTEVAMTDSALTINGNLYSAQGNIRLNRGFLTQGNNNTKPAVTIKYRPDFIFSMPGNLFKITRGFRQL